MFGDPGRGPQVPGFVEPHIPSLHHTGSSLPFESSHAQSRLLLMAPRWVGEEAGSPESRVVVVNVQKRRVAVEDADLRSPGGRVTAAAAGAKYDSSKKYSNIL